MANIGKIGTKVMAEAKGNLLTKFAKTPEQFSAVLKKDLKMKEPPKLDEFKKENLDDTMYFLWKRIR